MLRMGFALTQRQARQLVSHGHVKVDGRRVDVPARVRPGQTVEVSDKAKSFVYVREAPRARARRAALHVREQGPARGHALPVPRAGRVPAPRPDRGAAHHRVLLVIPVGTARYVSRPVRHRTHTASGGSRLSVSSSEGVELLRLSWDSSVFSASKQGRLLLEVGLDRSLQPAEDRAHLGLLLRPDTGPRELEADALELVRQAGESRGARRASRS